jgi:hypothetical protein
MTPREIAKWRKALEALRAETVAAGPTPKTANRPTTEIARKNGFFHRNGSR